MNFYDGALSVMKKDESDEQWIEQVLEEYWGGTTMVTRGTSHNLLQYPAWVAKRGDQPSGVLIYRMEQNECEILLLQSFDKYKGIGTQLLSTFLQSVQHEAERIWLITSNDNLDALRFYQKRHFSLTHVNVDAITRARETKASIPLTGYYGIPIKDELQLTYDKQ
ncbi:GNAT family N-acetyltransferase [Priestia koreensis]|uniref:GNAT family N-acetyltransferase n=1 Tax=Priestia koreensis TaxID=284581 RepID=UPI0030189711